MPRRKASNGRALASVLIALVVAVLAMGIGATTAVFSAVEAMFLRPLPYASAERIVMLWQRSTTGAAADEDVAPGNFVDWRAQWHIVNSIGRIEDFAGIYGFTGEYVDTPALRHPGVAEVSVRGDRSEIRS